MRVSHPLTGTLRSNLDPFNSHNDVTLNAALRDAGLLEDGSIDEKDALSNSSVTQLSLSDGKIKLGLDSEVKEDGANLSIGQVRYTIHSFRESAEDGLRVAFFGSPSSSIS
jgi:ABC-type multidrug transport system fused ATPase/permease subunit